MSRCFPFPPPGYEKKARPDQDANLLIKENHKDKKQKKDKKNKEKKEKRDKEKERSSEKQREKKERKHKHKDKKERNREKEEKKSAEEKRILGPLDHQNSEQFGQTSIQVGETQSSRLLLDLGKKVRNNNGAQETQIVERIRATDLSVKPSDKVLEHNVDLLSERIQKKDKREENRIPNGHFVNLNAIGLANGFVSNFPSKDQKNVGGGSFQEVKVMEKQKERKDTNKQKNSDGKGDKYKDGDREKKSKSKDKKRKKEKEKEKEKEKGNEFSSLITSKLRESGNNAVDCSNDRGSNFSKESILTHGNLCKRKEPEMDGVLNGNEVQSNKLPRPTTASNQVFQTGNRFDASNAAIQFAVDKEATVQRHKSNTKVSSSISVIQNGTRSEVRQTAINIAPVRQEVVNNNNKVNDRPFTPMKPALGDGRNLEPRETVKNFADREQGVVTNPTLDRKALPSQHVENGRRLESSQFNNLTAAEKQGTDSKIQLSDKESGLNGFVGPKLDERTSRINGVVELKKPSASYAKPASASGQHKDIFEMPVKAPHPDAKYLSEILSVPKVEWSDVDEQTWLFSSEDHLAKKPRNVSTMIEEPKQVWAEALHIESADVIALPYVIPY